jgi:F0F1-type ATP synthase epsilon subunit
MQFTIISPQQKKELAISWLEVNTPVGNFVIQRGHAPTILLVLPHQPVTVCLNNGKQETFDTPGGILEINRTKALLLLNE